MKWRRKTKQTPEEIITPYVEQLRKTIQSLREEFEDSLEKCDRRGIDDYIRLRKIYDDSFNNTLKRVEELEYRVNQAGLILTGGQIRAQEDDVESTS
jgi:hypothetical protein